jgi:hypothetical protein
VDYGGVFDLFYKIKILHEQGIQIHLHCFINKNRTEQSILNRYCASVHYYPRRHPLSSISFRIPWMVRSRYNKELIARLQEDNYPILLEGIHCTYPLYCKALQDRTVWVRLHNVEHLYYGALVQHESNWAKKIYYFIESKLLRRYEQAICQMAPVLPLSEKDAAYCTHQLKAKVVHFLPAFLPWKQTESLTGKGNFCLYQGNLAINENEKAAQWLLENVFNTMPIPFVIAGNHPSEALQQLAHKMQHTCIVVNPSDYEMEDLIKKAQINILPSFNQTGIKLKLLNAMFNGRHCLANPAAVEGSALTEGFATATDADSFKEAIQHLFNEPFTETNKQHRNAALQNVYDAQQNARKLIEWLY